MERAEYIMIHTYMIPEEFMTDYNLKDNAHNSYTFERVTKAMYELPQFDRIAHYAIVQNLARYGYHLKKT